MADDTVAALARLYLGNILYAIELAATSLAAEGKAEHAAYYRGIARMLAEAHGREKAAEQGDGQAAEQSAERATVSGAVSPAPATIALPARDESPAARATGG